MKLFIKKSSLFLLVLKFLINGASLSQDLENGFPFIKNYPPEEYNGFVQNWAFSEDSLGVVYVANRFSVLEYNGVNWIDIPIKNNLVNSLGNNNGVVYVGGTNEFGFLGGSNDEDSPYTKYYSLRNLLSDSLSIGAIWEVVGKEEFIYFRSNNFLISYNSNTKEIHYWIPSQRFSYLFKLGDQVYVRDSDRGVLRLEKNRLLKTEWGSFFKQNIVKSAFLLNGRDIFCTQYDCLERSGNEFKKIYLNDSEYIRDKYIDEVVLLKDKTILFATRSGGVVQVDSTGRTINFLNEENGLVSNTVYGLHEDRNGGVWVATVNGISRINYHLPFKVFDQRNGINEFIFDLIKWNGSLYATGASSGILMRKENSGIFEKIEVQAGCRQFFALEGSLYAICGGSLYLIKENEAVRITGMDLTLSVINNFPNSSEVFLANNLFQVVARIKGDQVIKEYEFNDITDDFNSIVIDSKNTIWLGTDTGGLYQIILDKEQGSYTSHTIRNYLKGLTNPSDDQRVWVQKIDEEAYFFTWGKGILKFDYQLDAFVQVSKFDSFFSDTTREYSFAVEDNYGNVWFRSESSNQVAIKQNNSSYKLEVGVLNFISSGQFHTIYPEPGGCNWYSIDKSLVCYNGNQGYDTSEEYQIEIVEVKVRSDSLINGGLNTKKDVLKYKDNELRFTYAAASYDAPKKTQYRVRLDGFEDDWGRWTSETFKDYTNIREGDYSFHVQARNVYGTISEASPFSFTVLPPWYRTWWAYMLYFISFSGLLYTGYKIRVNQLLKVERMRTKIASDLHDEVSATLTGISYFAEAIKRDKDQSKAAHFVSLISESAGDAKEKITDIVWSINPDNDSWELFLSKCRRFASDLLESKELEYNLKITEHIPGKLNMENRQHFWMIFKEMVTNAVRHSKATRLDVIMDVENGTLKLIVQDNGIGFDLDEIKEGNGIRNIKKRAAKIGATIKIHSEEDFGTRWRMELPL